MKILVFLELNVRRCCLSTIILKDNTDFFEIIKEYILKNEQLLPLKKYISPKELMQDFKENKVKADLLIIDIEEKSFDEILFIENIQSLNRDIQIIIISSNRYKAVEAFKINIFDYLLKPVSKKRLEKTIKKIKSQ
jgi:two-component SAPR family response regulator